MPMVNITINLHSQTVKDALVYLKKNGYISSISDAVRRAVRDFLIKELGYIEKLEDIEDVFAKKLIAEKEVEKSKEQTKVERETLIKEYMGLGNKYHPDKDYTKKEEKYIDV